MGKISIVNDRVIYSEYDVTNMISEDSMNFIKSKPSEFEVNDECIELVAALITLPNVTIKVADVSVIEPIYRFIQALKTQPKNEYPIYFLTKDKDYLIIGQGARFKPTKKAMDYAKKIGFKINTTFIYSPCKASIELFIGMYQAMGEIILGVSALDYISDFYCSTMCDLYVKTKMRTLNK